MQIRQLSVRIQTATIRRIVRIILADMPVGTQMGIIRQTVHIGTETAGIQMGTIRRTAQIIVLELADMPVDTQMGIIRQTAHIGTETAGTQMGTIRRTARIGAEARGIPAMGIALVMVDTMAADIMEEVIINGD